MSDHPVWLWQAPLAGGHWKVWWGQTWLGWVHRFDGHGRRWKATSPDGTELAEDFPRRQDAIAALTRDADHEK